MEFLPYELDQFVVQHTDLEPLVLQELSRETGMKMINPRMLSGHLQGRTLSMLSQMIAPKNVLEIGTFTGYSAICIAEGLQEKGQLITIDINEELEDITVKYFQKAGVGHQIIQKYGDAVEIIPTIEERFDLVFIDADKKNYSKYYDLIFDKLTVGGYIIADNVLWSGKVLEEYDTLDVDTKALVDFNKKVQADNRVHNVLFPIRDGLQVIRKKTI